MSNTSTFTDHAEIQHDQDTPQACGRNARYLRKVKILRSPFIFFLFTFSFKLLNKTTAPLFFSVFYHVCDAANALSVIIITFFLVISNFVYFLVTVHAENVVDFLKRCANERKIMTSDYPWPTRCRVSCFDQNFRAQAVVDTRGKIVVERMSIRGKLRSDVARYVSRNGSLFCFKAIELIWFEGDPALFSQWRRLLGLQSAKIWRVVFGSGSPKKDAERSMRDIAHFIDIRHARSNFLSLISDMGETVNVCRLDVVDAHIVVPVNVTVKILNCLGDRQIPTSIKGSVNEIMCTCDQLSEMRSDVLNAVNIISVFDSVGDLLFVISDGQMTCEYLSAPKVAAAILQRKKKKRRRLFGRA